MKTINLIAACLITSLLSCGDTKQELPVKEDVLSKLELVNGYLMKKWPDPGQTVTTNKERPSNLWTRGTYYNGLMALHTINPKDEYYKYAVDWAESHQWKFRGHEVHNPVIYNQDANVLCAAQTYIDLYEIDPQPERIKYAKMCIDSNIRIGIAEDWNWVDALYMAMPAYSKLSRVTNNDVYLDEMHKGFMVAKEKLGGSGLYNPEDGLWWRDTAFIPPYAEPNGEDCYWSRGNGWAYATLVRVMNDMPKEHKYYDVYLQMFKEMSEALLKVQRTDGYWNVSLHDPKNYGGKELTGTLFFAYGMIWGMNNGILGSEYQTPAFSAWNAVSAECIRPNGSLAYIQGTGDEPKDGQPVTYDSKPDFEDYGVGVFLLAGSEVYKYISNR